MPNCDHIEFCSYCKTKAQRELLIAAKIAYTILADIRHHWEGRHTIEGQGALIALRDSIAQATGREPQDVQDEFTNAKATS